MCQWHMLLNLSGFKAVASLMSSVLSFEMQPVGASMMSEFLWMQDNVWGSILVKAQRNTLSRLSDE
jgi:hypothetical protein